MKILLRIVLFLVAVIVLVGVVAYVDGTTLPVNHSTTVSGTVAASPEKVFATIVDVAKGASWRSEIKGVEMLAPQNGQDHWIEDLGHGTKMNFVATSTTPVDSSGDAKRVVLLSDPSYGGSWTYLVAPGLTPGQTSLTITEDGFINPPLYRFMMAHIFGMRRNLDIYMKDIQAEAPKR